MTITVSSTPAERRREKMRASILDAAEHVFAEHGAEGLSIRRLAKEIDYSPAAIYKYFGSKDELIDELKEAFFQKILDADEAFQDTSADFSERSRICLQMYVSIALEKPHHYAAAFSGTAELSQVEASNFLNSKKGQAFAILRDMVEEGQTLGVLRQDLDTELAAKSLWASCHGIAALMAHLPNFPALQPDDAGMSRDEFIAFHVDLIIRGIEQHARQTKQTNPSSQKRNP